MAAELLFQLLTDLGLCQLNFFLCRWVRTFQLVSVTQSQANAYIVLNFPIAEYIGMFCEGFEIESVARCSQLRASGALIHV